MLRVGILFSLIPLLFGSAAYGIGWSATASATSLFDSTVNTSVEFEMFLTANSLNGQVLATWSDGANSVAPTYSFFDGKSWSGPDVILNGSSVALDVSTSFNPLANTFIATWGDTTAMQPSFSIYSNGMWSSATGIPSTQTTTGRQVYNVYDAQRNLFWAGWTDSITNFPMIGSYNGSWSVEPITNASMSGISVYLASNGQGELLAVWTDAVSLQAMYSFYRGSWSAPLPISTISLPLTEVTACYNSFNGQFFAAWTDSGNFFPTYAIWNGDSWSDASTIPSAPTAGATGIISLSFASKGGLLLATWTDNMSSIPTYSFFDTSWSAPMAISSSSMTIMGFGTTSCYNPVTNQFFAGWGNSFVPTYSIFTIPTIETPSTPASFSGTQKINKFGVVQERYNALSWAANPAVTSYYLYRNDQLIALLAGTSDAYEDHNQPSSAQTYKLVASNGSSTSSAAFIVVGGGS